MAPRKARTHIDKLPSELLSKLATTVHLHSPSDIPACTLVSKRFNTAFRPFLFHTITFGPANPHTALHNLRLLLDQHPEIGPWIRTIIIHSSDMPLAAWATFSTKKHEEDEPTQPTKDFAAVLEKATALNKFQLSGAGACIPFGAFNAGMRDALLRLYTSKTLKTLGVGAMMIPPDILAHLSPSITSVVLNGLWGITESDVIFLNSYQAEMVQWMVKNCPQEERRQGPNIRSFSSVPAMGPLPVYLDTCPLLFQNLQKLELEAYGWQHPPIFQVQKFMELAKDTLEDIKITFDEFNLHDRDDPSGQTPSTAYLDFTNFHQLRHVSLSFTYTWQARHFPEYETMLQNMLKTLPSLENLETLDVILSWQWGDEAIDELGPPKLHEALRVLERSVPFIGQLDAAWAPFTDREKYKNLKRIRLSVKPWSEKSGVRPYDLSPNLGNWIQRFYNLYEFGYQALFPNLGRQRFFQYRTENNWFDDLDWVQPR